MVEKLNNENSELKTRLSQTCCTLNGEETIPTMAQDHNFNSQINVPEIRPLKRNQRPTSMYETREGYRTGSWQTYKNQKGDQAMRNTTVPTETHSLYGGTGTDSDSLEIRLTKSTENVTHCIHELWKSIQGSGRGEGCVPGAEKIKMAVNELTSIVPPVIYIFYSLQ